MSFSIAFIEPEAKILLDAQEKELDNSESDCSATKKNNKNLVNEADLVVEDADIDEQFEGLSLQEGCEVEEEVRFGIAD